jgi:hypothetical protein
MDCDGVGKAGRDASIPAEQQAPLRLGNITAIYISTQHCTFIS